MLEVVILSEPTQTIIQILLAVAAILSSFVAVAMYRKTNKDEIAKKIDLDATNENVMINKCDIRELDKTKASKTDLDKGIRGVHHRITETNENLSENIKQMIRQQSEMQKDIKHILLKIPG